MDIPLDKKQKLLSFIKSCEFGVIAIIAPNSETPESAVVAISETENLEIIFASFADTRKNKNVALNPHVSLVIGWDNTNKTTIQIEGTAVLLEGDEQTKLLVNHCIKNEASKKYINDPRQQDFKVIPSWIRYSNFSVDPQEVWDCNL